MKFFSLCKFESNVKLPQSQVDFAQWLHLDLAGEFRSCIISHLKHLLRGFCHSPFLESAMKTSHVCAKFVSATIDWKLLQLCINHFRHRVLVQNMSQKNDSFLSHRLSSNQHVALFCHLAPVLDGGVPAPLRENRFSPNRKCGVSAIFVHVCMLHEGHVTVAAHHMRKVSQRELVGKKTWSVMLCSRKECSLSDKNTQEKLCVWTKNVQA